MCTAEPLKKLGTATKFACYISLLLSPALQLSSTCANMYAEYLLRIQEPTSNILTANETEIFFFEHLSDDLDWRVTVARCSPKLLLTLSSEQLYYVDKTEARHLVTCRILLTWARPGSLKPVAWSELLIAANIYRSRPYVHFVRRR